MHFQSLPDEVRAQLINEHRAMTQYALTYLFDQPEARAAQLVRELSARFDDAPKQEQDLFVHNDPVALASKLSEKSFDSVDAEKLAKFNRQKESKLGAIQLGAL